MAFDKRLDILLICNYQLEKNFFFEKVGSGDFYRELTRNDENDNNVLEERELKELDRVFFSFIHNEASKERLNSLSDKRIKELHYKCIDYYQHKTMKYDKSYGAFDRYANRYINLIGHCLEIGDIDEIERILGDVGILLYKWGYKDYLKQIIDELIGETDDSTIKRIHMLYELDQLSLKPAMKDSVRNEYRSLLVDTDFVDLIYLLNDELEEDHANVLITNSLLKNDELDRLVAQTVIGNVRYTLSDDIYIPSKELIYFDSKVFAFISNYTEINSDELQSQDPYYNLLLSECAFISHMGHLIEDDNYLHSAIQHFINTHILKRKLKFNCMPLYVDLVLKFLEFDNSRVMSTLIPFCKGIVKDKSVSTFIQGNQLINRVIKYHESDNQEDQIKLVTMYDKLFNSYVKLFNE